MDESVAKNASLEEEFLLVDSASWKHSVIFLQIATVMSNVQIVQNPVDSQFNYGQFSHYSQFSHSFNLTITIKIQSLLYNI